VTAPFPSSDSQHLCPDILFRTGIISNDKEESPSFESAELVRKDQCLVNLVKKTTASPRKNTLLEGPHTVLSADNTSLAATVDGYPFLSRQRGADTETLSVSLIPLLSIAEDKMEAAITLYPSVPGGHNLTGERLFEILRDNGIQVGLDSKYLQELVHRCDHEQAVLSAQTVARGILPLDGRDSFLRFDIEIGPFPGKILGNGKIDFRERKMFVGVKEGQVIATKIPATAGTPGINVLGAEIPQQAGKDIPVTVSEDAEYDEANGVIRALRSGILSLVNENSIKVCAKQIISGDIDFSTGNIESKDAVEISGSVLSGFEVHTLGDLLINGSVRSASIHCQGNLIIKEGIIGKDSKIQVRGDADFLFMELGHLRSGGRVIIRKQAYYSEIMADGDIHGHEDSQIMAGLLLSGGSISLGSVGSSNAPPTLLGAGIEPERYVRYIQLHSQLHTLEKELQLWLQRHGQQTKGPHRQALQESIRTMNYNLHKLNLAPGTSLDEPEIGLKYLRGISIIVHNTIFAGTHLQIGKACKTVEQDLKAIRFLLSNDGNTLIATDL